MPLLLVIDDEENVRYSFRYVFEENDVRVLGAATAGDGLHVFREHRPDVVVLDLQLPDRSGLEAFHEIRHLDPKTPVIIITAHGTADTAIEAMKHGAFDYLVKPVDLERLSKILSRAFDAVSVQHEPADADDDLPIMIGRSTAMQEMSKLIGRIAPQDTNVLILGESGVGKELVARAIYEHSRRADKPFLAINCAAIPEALLESELFGHEQGAFTGAQKRRIGKFEQCDQGTLFLDEIGDMVPSLQSKMLRVLQEQRFERIGGNQTLQTRVRIFAATNQPLEQLVEQGRFRRDLYYRLKGATIQVPTLRERLDDIPQLAHHFLMRLNRECSMNLQAIAAEALQILQRYSWPGNIRELQNTLREAILRASGRVLLPEFLPDAVRLHSATTAPTSLTLEESLSSMVEGMIQRGETNLHSRAIEALERTMLPLALRVTRGQQGKAAELLGISRNTLRQKLRTLGFAVDKILVEEDSEQAER